MQRSAVIGKVDSEFENWRQVFSTSLEVLKPFLNLPNDNAIKQIQKIREVTELSLSDSTTLYEECVKGKFTTHKDLPIIGLKNTNRRIIEENDKLKRENEQLQEEADIEFDRNLKLLTWVESIYASLNFLEVKSELDIVFTMLEEMRQI